MRNYPPFWWSEWAFWSKSCRKTWTRLSCYSENVDGTRIVLKFGYCFRCLLMNVYFSVHITCLINMFSVNWKKYLKLWSLCAVYEKKTKTGLSQYIAISNTGNVAISKSSWLTLYSNSCLRKRKRRKTISEPYVYQWSSYIILYWIQIIKGCIDFKTDKNYVQCKLQ